MTGRMDLISTDDVRARSARTLPRFLYDYIEGGADDERVQERNRRAFDELELRPRIGWTGTPSLATSVVGVPLSMPVLLAPCGIAGLVHPDGAPGVARAASGRGTVAVLSKIALATPAQVAPHDSGARWFQLNSAGGRDAALRACAQAADAGYTGLVLTMDGPPPGNHERDRRHGVVPPVELTPRFLAGLAGQAARRPRWTAAMTGASLGEDARRVREFLALLRSGGAAAPSRFGWGDVRRLRDAWEGPLVVKGVMDAEDARSAVAAGADAVVVSNHGGRALGDAPATLSVLGEVVDAVGGDVDVLVDGGVRRAGDVVKALALGARAVLVGRPWMHALAVGGTAGVEALLDLFATELHRTLTLIGCASVGELDSRHLRLPAPTEATGFLFRHNGTRRISAP